MFAHEFPFDPTYGYTRERLLAVAPPPEPDDFDAFWRDTYEEARGVGLRLTREAVASPSARHDVAILRFRTLGGLQVGAWLVTPRGRAVESAAVVGHGYGGREQPDFERRPVAALHVCSPGFNLSAAPGLPASAGEHVVHGIGSRETYILRACVAAVWSAAWVLCDLYPALGGQLRYLGCSFGGGLGALAVPWEASFARSFLDVPTFGHHPIRLQSRCVGSGEAVREHRRAHPEVDEVLAYYDAATAAARLRIPTLVAAALFDPAVPPPGQFAVYRALAGPRELFVRRAAHFDPGASPAEERRLRRRIDAVVWGGDAPHAP